MPASSPFRIGLTRDFLKPDGTIGFGDIGLSLFDTAPNVTWEFLADHSPILTPQQIAGFDGLLVLAPQVTAATLVGNDRLSLIARFGVGYDNVDVPACTAAGVMLTITPDGVRRPVAVSAITLLLALSHKLLIKDRLTRTGRWAEKLNHMGQGVKGRTLGVLGVGNIGREIFQLAAPFEMRHLGYDPFLKTSVAGVELVSFETILQESDYLIVSCALTPETHHLLNADRLALMKSNAYLINVARGPIIDQLALTDALAEQRIAGAGLDVFAVEPIANDDPLLALDNVILSPHGICWTDECFQGIGRSACQSLIDVAAGRTPTNLVNRDVLNSPRLRSLYESRVPR
ncbi:NAD(P)-dependent oxidoreductase [Schlesneria paludicola]|uniref:NAD(P)-dependent oxidoreductase n=1 Tax=Schlesneria paludicola TaxID=360056 RepID=UPI000299F565|nr:NAD(P)-dependent oxidoreductase [Schlesneria paludicola]